MVRFVCSAAVIAALTNRTLRDAIGVVLPIIIFVGAMVTTQWLNTALDKWTAESN
jgi:hypothetical protein